MDIVVSQGAFGSAELQGHGWVLTCDRNGVFVRRRSAGIGDIFPEAKGRSENLALAAVVGDEAAHALRNAMTKAARCSRPILLPRLPAGSGGGIFDVALHVAGEEIVIEFEPASSDLAHSPLDLARGMIDRITVLDDPERLMASATHLLAAGLRFDRVVVARAEGAATMAAATRLDGVTSFSGDQTEIAALRLMMAGFPRACRSRAIHDVGASSTALVSLGDAASQPDLTRATLRAASEEERRALRDLGAASCLLAPIFAHGDIWGFFICLDPLPRWPSMELRAVAELFVEFFSLRLEGVLPRNHPSELRLDFPERAASPRASLRSGGAGDAALSILIVEDQWLIAQDLEFTLVDHGCGVADICASVEEALFSLDHARPDAAVLDLILRGGKTSFPVATALRQQGVPFIFATGYGDRDAIPEEFSDVPMVGKPYAAKAVLDALAAALARSGDHARPAEAAALLSGKKSGYGRCPE